MRRNLKIKTNGSYISDYLENYKQRLVKEADSFVAFDSVWGDQSSAEEWMLK